MIRNMLIVAAFAFVTQGIAAPPEAKSQIKLGGVSLGMSEADLQELAKKRRRKLQGPGKGMISAEEMVAVKEYTVAKDRQFDPIRGAKTQTIMLLDGKVIAVKLHFRGKSDLQSYLKTFEKAGFTKESDTLYTGTIDVGELAGRKVKVKVNSFKINRKEKHDVIISSLEVLGKGITAEKLMEAQRGGGIRKGIDPDEGKEKSRKGIGGVL